MIWDPKKGSCCLAFRRFLVVGASHCPTSQRETRETLQQSHCLVFSHSLLRLLRSYLKTKNHTQRWRNRIQYTKGNRGHVHTLDRNNGIWPMQQLTIEPSADVRNMPNTQLACQFSLSIAAADKNRAIQGFACNLFTRLDQLSALICYRNASAKSSCSLPVVKGNKTSEERSKPNTSPFGSDWGSTKECGAI